jgi:cytochrome oxidase Cu insertion factor (SCO1/SenC/PrrC family)
MQPSLSQRNTLSKWTISGLFLLCLFPLLAAWFLFFDKAHWHFKTTAHGELLTPPLSLDSLALPPGIHKQISGHWLLMRTSQTACDAACQQSLYFMRQIHIATGKDSDRVRRIWITTTTAPKKMDPSFIPLITTLSPADYNQFMTTLAAHEHNITPSQPAIFIVDPHGNIVLCYPEQTKGSDILADLKKLLGVSGIG